MMIFKLLLMVISYGDWEMWFLQMGMLERALSWGLDWWYIMQLRHACDQRVRTLQLSNSLYEQKDYHDTPKDVACEWWKLQGASLVYSMETKRPTCELSAAKGNFRGLVTGFSAFWLWVHSVSGHVSANVISSIVVSQVRTPCITCCFCSSIRTLKRRIV